MNIPIGNETDKVRGAVRRLCAADKYAWETLVGWIRAERDKRDAENRIVGKENKYSEAQALTVMVDYFAACMGSADGEQEEQQ